MSEIDPESTDIADTTEKLSKATGHYTWHWHNDGYFRTAALEGPIALALANDFEGLDVQIARDSQTPPTVLAVRYDDAKDFIERAALERPQGEPSSDPLQKFLSDNYRDLVWYATGEGHARGYIGYGYDLMQEESIVERFRQQHVRAKLADAKPNHDDRTHGLFLSEDSVRDLMQKQQGAARG